MIEETNNVNLTVKGLVKYAVYLIIKTTRKTNENDIPQDIINLLEILSFLGELHFSLPTLNSAANNSDFEPNEFMQVFALLELPHEDEFKAFWLNETYSDEVFDKDKKLYNDFFSLISELIYLFPENAQINKNQVSLFYTLTLILIGKTKIDIKYLEKNYNPEDLNDIKEIFWREDVYKAVSDLLGTDNVIDDALCRKLKINNNFSDFKKPSSILFEIPKKNPFSAIKIILETLKIKTQNEKNEDALKQSYHNLYNETFENLKLLFELKENKQEAFECAFQLINLLLDIENKLKMPPPLSLDAAEQLLNFLPYETEMFDCKMHTALMQQFAHLYWRLAAENPEGKCVNLYRLQAFIIPPLEKLPQSITQMSNQDRRQLPELFKALLKLPFEQIKNIITQQLQFNVYIFIDELAKKKLSRNYSKECDEFFAENSFFNLAITDNLCGTTLKEVLEPNIDLFLNYPFAIEMLIQRTYGTEFATATKNFIKALTSPPKPPIVDYLRKTTTLTTLPKKDYTAERQAFFETLEAILPINEEEILKETLETSRKLIENDITTRNTLSEVYIKNSAVQAFLLFGKPDNFYPPIEEQYIPTNDEIKKGDKENSGLNPFNKTNFNDFH